MDRGSVVTKYPLYVPSKGRADCCYTAEFLIRDQVPFRLVVEPSEEKAYRAQFPDVEVLVTPKDDMRLLGVRNWIRDHSVSLGAERHWQFDDNIVLMARWHKAQRIRCDSKIGFAAAEEFTDRYTNIGLSGFNYDMFAVGKAPPFRVNTHVYSASLIKNDMPYTWRLLYNDDTDLCLQVLAGGLCTVQINAFVVKKLRTMIVKGGNTEDLYQGDGRLKMARTLERMWPGIVTTERRYGRPQHVINWRKFRTPLIRRDDLDWDEIARKEWKLTRKATVR
jgi:hypothetical protein